MRFKLLVFFCFLGKILVFLFAVQVNTVQDSVNMMIEALKDQIPDVEDEGVTPLFWNRAMKGENWTISWRPERRCLAVVDLAAAATQNCTSGVTASRTPSSFAWRWRRRRDSLKNLPMAAAVAPTLAAPASSRVQGDGGFFPATSIGSVFPATAAAASFRRWRRVPDDGSVFSA
uniref:Uncharacterized protein n=1 Tax=Oryza meridionalis TaxID=40149 RepID=A0A0E0E3E5_9ORYZ